MFSFLFLSTAVMLGAAPEATITAKDVDIVLRLAAREANKKLGSEYCVKPTLDIGRASWAGKVGKDGWITAPGGAAFRYRPLRSPDLERLPATAARAFTKARIGSNCRHIISFQNPKFIQIKSETDDYIEADVDFRDRCPLCGFGAVIRFRKVGSSWMSQPPFIENTWIS